MQFRTRAINWQKSGKAPYPLPAFFPLPDKRNRAWVLSLGGFTPPNPRGVFEQGNWQLPCYNRGTVQPGKAMTVKEMNPPWLRSRRVFSSGQVEPRRRRPVVLCADFDAEGTATELLGSNQRRAGTGERVEDNPVLRAESFN